MRPLWHPVLAICNCALCQHHGWHIPADPCSPTTPQMRAAQRRVEHRHVRALADRGVPLRDMLDGCVWAFGVVTLQGREMIVTDDARMRAYLSGPGLFQMPGGE